MNTPKKENPTEIEGYPTPEPYIEHPYVFRISIFQEVIKLVQWRGHSPVTNDLFVKASESPKKA